MLSAIRAVVTDRFVIVLILGGGLFLLEALTEEDGYDVRIRQSDVAMLKARWQAQSGAEPGPEESASLIDFHIREEILVREALRLGLDQDDVIVRRRLAQKMELLLRDSVGVPGITADAVAAYFKENQSRYTEPKRVGFRHIFLGRKGAYTPGSIEAMMVELEGAQDPSAWKRLGKPSMIARELRPRTETELKDLFGPGFAARLFKEDATGDWWGPVQSSYGFHLVQIMVVSPERVPVLEEVRARVFEDARDAALKQGEREAWRRLRATYRVDADAVRP